MSEEIERSADLIERLLGDPELRHRFRTDPASVLREHGLLELAEGLGRGRRALMTLELRESRSSLAGVMVAAAAEGVDFTHVAERAAPGLEREAGRAVDRLLHPPSHHPAHAAPAKPSAAPAPAPARPSIGASAQAPPLASPPPASGSAHPAPPASPLPQSAPAGRSGAAGGGAAPAPSHAQAGGFAAAPGQEAAQTGQPQGQAVPDSHAAPAGHVAPTGHAAPTDHAAPTGHAAPAEHPVPAPDVQADPATYPGDSATPQQLAAWMGAYAQRAGLPPELPVMASLTESGLRNLSYGDRDSVGFFQMRLGIWNEGAYAGYPDRPDLQMQWFIDHAVAARNADPALAQSPSTWGEWVANVEQPAAEYRYRYQLQLGTAQALLRGADLAPAPDQVVHVAVGQQAVEVAKKLVGTSYGLGGSDASGLVQYAYAREGIQLPRVAAEQFDVGIPVAREHLRPGDAVFFADDSRFVHHVGLYIGDGHFISAPEASGRVKTFSLSDPAFSAQYAGARRYTAAALSDPSRYARSLPTIKP